MSKVLSFAAPMFLHDDRSRAPDAVSDDADARDHIGIGHPHRSTKRERALRRHAYAVVADGIGGRIDAIVIELATGGDNAMIYEGFPAPQERAPAHFNSPSDPSVRSDRSAAALRR